MAHTPAPLPAVSRPTLLGVRVGPDHETPPGPEHYVGWLHCLSIDRGAGDRLASATFAYDLSWMGQRVQNEFLTEHMNRTVEVWALRSQPGRSDTLLFRGELQGSRLDLADGVERKVLWAAVMPHHFGEVIEGPLVWNDALGEEGETETLHTDLEINPQVDGKVLDNRISPDDERNDKTFSIWVDPDSVRTETAREEHHGQPVAWTLERAVESICGMANEEETTIRNMDGDLLQRITDGAPAPENVILERGQYLPGYLSVLLLRYGYNWVVDFQTFHELPEGEEEGEPQDIPRGMIRVFKRGSGTMRSVKLQALGENLDAGRSNVSRIGVEYEISSLANVVKVTGSPLEWEITVPLFCGWSTDDDGTEDHGDVENPVGRLLVANEADDFHELRPEITLPDLSFLGPVRRRVARPCLTFRDVAGQNERRPPLVEFKLPDGEWTDIRLARGADTESGEFSESAIDGDFAEFRLLDNQLGIYVTAVSSGDATTAIPLLFLSSGTEFRMTCSVLSDKSLEYETDQAEASPQSAKIVRWVEARDRFFKRQRQADGDCASILTGDADLRDDTTEMEDHAVAVLDTVRAANVAASLLLPGLNWGYQIGDILPRVEGREISFSRLARGAAGESYLQIVGVRFSNEPKSQYTELICEKYDA